MSNRLRDLLLTASLFGAAPLNAFQYFEGDGFDTWTEEGSAFGRGPTSGEVPGMNAKVTGFAGEAFACSGHGGDASIGSLTSPDFTIGKRYIHFLIAGGKHPGKTAVQLLIDGKVAEEATGQDSVQMRAVAWDVAALKGKKARIRITDQETGRWGIIAADHIVFSDEAKVEFPKPVAVAEEGSMEASPVIAGNNVPKGTSLKVFADFQGEKVTSPTAITFDEKGDLYVAETHRFRFGVLDDRQIRFLYLDDLASKTVADRGAMLKKWSDKIPPASLTAKSEVIRRLVDKDGDGKADGMSVFADGFNDPLDGTAAGIFSHLGKTYFACIPKIYSLEDANGDGVSDKRTVIQDGFGVRISLSGHDMNGFVLGNDGRIYGTIGDRGFDVKTREGREYHSPDRGAIFRFEPDGSNFEVVHSGLRNPKELAFDEFGNGITVDNNSDQGDPSRIVYVMEGADSGWRMQHQALFTFRDDIGLTEKPISPWMTERMPNTRNSDQPAFIVPPLGNLTAGPSGLTYHPGAGFLESEKGRFLICDYKAGPAASGIWSFKVRQDGAGMKYEGAYKFNWGVCATDVEYSYDGRVFVSDFIGGWESHDDGRIYALSADKEKNGGRTPETAKLIKEGFDQRPADELARLLAHPDQRVRMRAHIALASKTGGTAALTAATKQSALLVRLHGVWGLGIRARKNADKDATATLIALLKDSDAEVRAQATHVLGEVAATKSTDLLPLLKDSFLRVRAFAAISLGRQKAKDALQPVLAMLAENADADLYLRHAGVMGLLGSATPQQIVALSSHESKSVRLAAVIALRRLKDPEIAKFLVDADPKIVDEAIRAIHDERIETARPAEAALLDAYTGNGKPRALTPMIARRLIHCAFRLGGKQNADRLVRAAASSSLDLDQRIEALRLLGQWDEPFPVDQSIGIFDRLPKRDISEVAPTLEAGLPALLKGEEALLAPTLQLVEHLKLGKKSLPEEALRRIVTTAKLPQGARSTALELLLAGNPPDADTLLVTLAGDSSDVVAKEALTLLSTRNPAKAIDGVKSALGAPGFARRQLAWTLAAGLPGEVPAQLIIKALADLVAGKGDRSSEIELVEAAGKRGEPAVKEALAAYKASIKTDDPLGAWMASLDGGDAARGEQVFQSHGTAQCIRCHRAGEPGHDNGGDAGPNLAGVGGRHDRLYMLESLINPMAKVAPGYAVVSLTLKNGGNVGGILDAETPDYYDVTVGDKSWRVKKSDVASASPPVSAMPPMSALLNPREARDLVAFLSSMKTPLKEKAKKPEPKPFDPTTALPGK